MDKDLKDWFSRADSSVDYCFSNKDFKDRVAKLDEAQICKS